MNQADAQHRSALPVLFAALFAWVTNATAADENLQRWKGAAREPVSALADRHVIHSYFNTCPESPDGKLVVYFTSGAREGERGDLRVLDRATKRETVIARDITAEDAHRAACQQWSRGGKTVVYHDCREGRWCVVAVDVATGKEKILVQDRQLGFGAVSESWVPVYGCHWNPGVHRNIELVNVETGETRTAVEAGAVVSAYPDWIRKRFQSTDLSLFFPVVSPDGRKIFFKLAKPGGGDDFRSKQASDREGKVIFDLETKQLVRLVEQWGHPSWTPDSTGIFERGNYIMDAATGKTRPRFAPSCFSDHPSLSADGRLFVTDADVTKRPFGRPGYWAVAVGSTAEDAFELVDLFDNSKGATSWRHNHPHPVFSADGRRIYYNVNSGPWTQLMVANRSDP